MTRREVIVATLAGLKLEDLYAVWRWAELMEASGEISAAEAQRWKEGVFELMVEWKLSPNDVFRLRAVQVGQEPELD